MALHHKTRIPLDGLIMCLDAANVKSYPGSGTVVYDISKNSYNHNLVNGAALTTQDGVTCFDCTGNNFLRDAGSTFTFGPAHTMIAWARVLPDAAVSTWRTLWRDTNHPVIIQNTTNLIGFYDGAGGSQFNSFGLDAGVIGVEETWTMYTSVGNSGSTTLYINDGVDYSGSVSVSTEGEPHDTIGNYSTGSQPFGYVANALVYDRALSLTDIQTIYHSYKGRFGV